MAFSIKLYLYKKNMLFFSTMYVCKVAVLWLFIANIYFRLLPWKNKFIIALNVRFLSEWLYKKKTHIYFTSRTFFFNTLFFLYTFTQIIAALAVSLGPLAAGLGKGYPSPAIVSLQRGNNTFPVSPQQGSWIASLSLLGKFN